MVALTNGAGEITKTYAYDPFGAEKNIDLADNNPFRYCSEYYDKGIDKIYLRARTYDPTLGRFTQQDPACDGFNWYVYCYNNPVNFTDSMGLDPDLDEYVKSNYPGKVTVTIAAARPVENSRTAVDLNTGDVGHTFVRIDYGDGRVIYRGFYPSSPLTSEQILTKADVAGTIVDDSDHDWNAAVTYEVTPEQADKIVTFINNYTKKYNMVTNNCTTFSVQVLSAGGVVAPTSEHKWTLPDNTRQMVIDNLPSDKWFRGAVADYLIGGLKGYSPADAVQDFKKTSKYVLKYGGTMHSGSNAGKIK